MSAIPKVTIGAAVGAVLLAAIAAGPVAAAAPAGPKAACPAWNGVQPPDRNLAALSAVTVLPTCQAWAVGATRNPSQLLIEEFSGSTWTRQAIPMLSFGAELAGVTATAADNAWAVGSEHPAAEGKKIQPLIIGWDGRSWSVQASPPLPPGAVSGELTGVAASSADNAWAVGNYGIGTVHQPLILQSNGTSWTQVRSPDPGGPAHSSFLTSVTVVSPHDAWAAGYYRSAGFAGYRTLILHWNGTTWSQVPTPAPSPAHQGQLYGITATSPRNAWAAGYQTQGSYATLILHWNGHAWRWTPGPAIDEEQFLAGVAASPTGGAWVVGRYLPASRKEAGTFAMRWNGQSWQQ